MDRTGEGHDFQNQPRLGAAIRQRSHSSKELATMLQQLQLSVQLMPLSQPANQPNLASTSEEDSDSLNSNEASTSEDEAFGDYEDEEDDYEFEGLKAFGKLEASARKPRTKSVQLNLSSSFSTDLVYPGKLRRSNSLGVLNSKSYKELYCDDDYEEAESFRDSFRVFSNEFRRSGSFRSTLPRVRLRYSTSLKDNLNSLSSGYCSDNYASNYVSKLGDEFGGKFAGKFSDKFNDKYRDACAKKYADSVRSGGLFAGFGDYFSNEQPGKSDKRTSDLSEFREMSSRDAESKQTSKADDSSSPTATSSRATGALATSAGNRNLVSCNQSSTSGGRPSSPSSGAQAGSESITRREGDCLSLATSLAASVASSSARLSSFNQLNHPKASDHSRHSIAGGDNCAAASGLVGSAVSGGAYDITAPGGSTAGDINNKVNSESSVSSCVGEASAEHSSSDEFRNSEKSEIHSKPGDPQQQQTTESSAGSSLAAESSDKCVIQTTTSHLQPRAPHTKPEESQRLNELFAGAQQPEPQQIVESQQTGLPCDASELSDVLVTCSGAQQPVIKSILKRSTRVNRRVAQLASKSPDLPVLFEEHGARSIGDPSAVPHPAPAAMQTLAETQYNQLGYHMAALSCVCDNKQNLTSNYSPFASTSSNSNSNNYNNQNSPSSVDSDEYSSPYNSPPSSPSSVSSYSSAEEDCSILTSCMQNGLKLNGHSSAGSLSKALSGSNQSLADLITVDHSKLVSEIEPSIDVVDCAAAFASSRGSPVHHQGLLTTATSLAAFNSDLNNNKDASKVISLSNSLSNSTISNGPIRLDHSEQRSDSSDDDQLITEKQSAATGNYVQQSSTSLPTSPVTNDPPAQSAKPQPRVRKTSILRNQTPPDLANYCKKEVKFADTLGFELEKVKYFPPASPQVKPKRHSVNLASLHRDYDEQHELFILHSRPQTEDIQTLAKRFEERSALFSKQQTKLNLDTNIFRQPNQPRAGGSYYSPPSQWGGHLFRDEYCGDMFHPFEGSHPTTVNTPAENGDEPDASTSSTIKAANLMGFSPMSYKSSSLEFNGFKFMNNQMSSSFNSLPSLSSPAKQAIFLPLNFCAQPHIQSDFPNRLHSQSVLLHSLEFVGHTINGIISVINLTFEKKIVVKHTLNKWVTEKQCEARYSKKDCDNSDKFVFQITLKESDFPQFQLDEDRTMMFAVRYETGDGRIFWDNNFGSDYRLKCKFN